MFKKKLFILISLLLFYSIQIYSMAIGDGRPNTFWVGQKGDQCLIILGFDEKRFWNPIKENNNEDYVKCFEKLEEFISMPGHIYMLGIPEIKNKIQESKEENFISRILKSDEAAKAKLHEHIYKYNVTSSKKFDIDNDPMFDLFGLRIDYIRRSIARLPECVKELFWIRLKMIELGLEGLLKHEFILLGKKNYPPFIKELCADFLNIIVELKRSENTPISKSHNKIKGVFKFGNYFYPIKLKEYISKVIAFFKDRENAQKFLNSLNLKALDFFHETFDSLNFEAVKIVCLIDAILMTGIKAENPKKTKVIYAKKNIVEALIELLTSMTSDGFKEKFCISYSDKDIEPDEFNKALEKINTETKMADPEIGSSLSSSSSSSKATSSSSSSSSTSIICTAGQLKSACAQCGKLEALEKCDHCDTKYCNKICKENYSEHPVECKTNCKLKINNMLNSLPKKLIKLPQDEIRILEEMELISREINFLLKHTEIYANENNQYYELLAYGCAISCILRGKLKDYIIKKLQIDVEYLANTADSYFKLKEDLKNSCLTHIKKIEESKFELSEDEKELIDYIKDYLATKSDEEEKEDEKDKESKEEKRGASQVPDDSSSDEDEDNDEDDYEDEFKSPVDELIYNFKKFKDTGLKKYKKRCKELLVQIQPKINKPEKDIQEIIKYFGKKFCIVCNKFSRNIKSCKSCFDAGIEIKYCSEECQREDWEAHRKICYGFKASATKRPKSSGGEELD